MDPRLVSKGVAADDRLVRLDGVAGQARDQAAGARELGCLNSGVQAVEVGGAGGQQHHELFERGIAGALSNPVDRALHLPRACEHASERVCHGETKVVMAVGRKNHIFKPGRGGIEPFQEARVFLGHCVTDRVGNVDRRCPFIDRDLADLSSEVNIGARRIHRRELNVVAELPGLRDRRPCQTTHVVVAAAHLVFDVDLGG